MAHYSEPRDVTKKRMIQHGMWKTFLAFRNALVKEGISRRDSHQLTIDEFPASKYPLDEKVALAPPELDERGHPVKERYDDNLPEPVALVSKEEVEKAEVKKASEKILKWDGKVDYHRDFGWAANNMGVQATLKDAPSPFAYEVWRQLQNDSEFKKIFFSQIIPKIMPSAKDREEALRMKDTNRTTEELLDSLKRKFENKEEV